MATGLTAVTMGSAGAAPAKLHATYRVTGSTHIANLNSDIPLGPAHLGIDVDNSGHFTGSLPLPKVRTHFLLLIGENPAPAAATITFVPVGPVTGSIGQVGNKIKVTSKATEMLKISDVRVNGYPGEVGANCHSVDPVTLNLTNKGVFDIGKGGTLTATYPISDFTDCGGLTPALTYVITGPGNTATVQLGNGRLDGTPATTAYTATGTSAVKAAGATMKLGPAPLLTMPRPGGHLIGTLHLPKTSLAFTKPFQDQIVPVTSDVGFTQVGPVTATVTKKGTAYSLVGGTHQNLILSNIVINGLAAKNTGNTCRSKFPLNIRFASTKGFTPAKGGTLVGTYVMPTFHRCGIYTTLLNTWLSGPGNTFKITIAPAKT